MKIHSWNLCSNTNISNSHEYEGEDWIFSKGGAGGFKKLVKWKVKDGDIVPIEEGDFDVASKSNREMASKAMRVIALCARKVTEDAQDVITKSVIINLNIFFWFI